MGAARLIDLSHTVEHGMVTYQGLPAPLICDYLARADSRARYAPGTEFQIGRIDMVANTGTYVDSPFHRYAAGKDLADLPLESLAALPCLVARIDPDGPAAIDRLPFDAGEVRGKAVLVHTGWDVHWGREAYAEGCPYLTEEAARLLAEGGARLVGIDAHNIDCTDGGARPVHSLLLGREIPVAEHLCNLQALPDQGFRLFAVPVKVRGMGTFPVRAFAVVP
jgi:kynurenine formamidase